jgi:hypothetical protein
VKICSRLAETDNTLIEMISECAEDRQKIHQQKGKVLNKELILVVKKAVGFTSNYWWSPLVVVATFEES